MFNIVFEENVFSASSLEAPINACSCQAKKWSMGRGGPQNTKFSCYKKKILVLPNIHKRAKYVKPEHFIYKPLQTTEKPCPELKTNENLVMTLLLFLTSVASTHCISIETNKIFRPTLELS